MRKIILVFVLALVIFVSASQNLSAQLNQEWVTRYNGPVQYTDKIQDIAL